MIARCGLWSFQALPVRPASGRLLRRGDDRLNTPGRPAVGQLLACRCRRLISSCVAALGLAGVAAHAPAQDMKRTNVFDDPFVRVTTKIKDCAVPEGPLVTAEEAKAQAHYRVERGTTCSYSGRCRLSNSYLYDKEIVPRVARFIQMDDRFADSSVWVLGQRRWVYLKGCMRSAQQIQALVAEVRLFDDVETVINELSVGTEGKRLYRPATP